MPSKKPSTSRVSAAGSLDPDLLDLLVCPLTKTTLSYDSKRQELVSQDAGLAFPIRDGIPYMLVSEARRLTRKEVK